MDEVTLKMLVRLKNHEDGKDFLDFLVKSSLENYNSWKLEGGDILRGKAIAYDDLIALFQHAEEKLSTRPSYDNWA